MAAKCMGRCRATAHAVAPGLHSSRCDGSAYIVLVAASKTAKWYEEILEDGNLNTSDPPRLCVSPSSGRFEASVFVSCLG